MATSKKKKKQIKDCHIKCVAFNGKIRNRLLLTQGIENFPGKRFSLNNGQIMLSKQVYEDVIYNDIRGQIHKKRTFQKMFWKNTCFV